ncbi:MAG TPA: hemerythrin domain-containing protein, partial [Myxococcales bacterium]|nr:hemerythrin domain-containing protein [Myxococcales bacterium]
MATVGDRLLHDHSRLDRLFGELLDQFAEGNRRAVRAAWVQLEDGLIAHMAAEERHLLPLFEEIDLRETLALQGDHVALRRMLAELAVAIDLDLVQADLARTFIDTLRAHARREEDLLYRWASRRI